MPLSSCLAFIGSEFSIYLNISGEKLGNPLKWSDSPEVIVSPILKFPVSGIPTMSPGKASSTIFFFWAMKAVGAANFIVLPERIWRYGAFRSNLPEHTLTKAMQERWLGSILAWILNTNPEKPSSSGFISLSSATVGLGDGAILTKQSSNSLTPKVLRAEAKNTGATLPSRYSSTLNSGYTPSMSSRSSRSFSASASPTASSIRGSFTESISTRSLTLCLSGVKRSRECSNILYTPLNFAPIFIGQESGRTLILSSLSNSSRISKGSRPSRSSLLTKIITGVLRIRHTSINLRVCCSTPLATSTTIITLSTAVNVLYVSSAKSWWPGVSRILIL